MSAIIADVFIWRGWLQALERRDTDALLATGHSAHVIGLGIAAMVACLTTVILVACAVRRIRVLHAGVVPLAAAADIAASALTLRTASAAIVALAVAAICAIALGF